MVWFSISFLLIGVYLTRCLFRHFHEVKLLRLREIVHAERLSALDHSVELPDSPTREIEEALRRGSDAPVVHLGWQRNELGWARITALALGLIGLFGGIGTVVGLYFVPDRDVQGTWPLGIIPALIGIGLLLFVRLTREVAASVSMDADTQ